MLTRLPVRLSATPFVALLVASSAVVACNSAAPSDATDSTSGSASSSGGTHSGSSSTSASGSHSGNGTSNTNGSSTSANNASGSGSGSSSDSGSTTATTTSDGGIGGAAAAIHDDFESGSLSSTWSLWNEYGVPNAQYTPVTTVAVDTTHAHSGTYAVKITGGGNNGGLFGTPPPSQSFYGRAWIYLGASPGMAHWATIVGLAPGSQGPEVRIGGNLGVYDVNVTPSDADMRGTATAPVAQWMCIEFYYTTQSLQYWQDGQSILDVTPTTTWTSGAPPSPWISSYADIAFGFAGENGTPVDTWVDDVALDTSRIGCN